jgi:flagellar hook assembly protein FlgD
MKVYEKSNYINEWGGEDEKGNELPTGTYYYVIEFKDGKDPKTGWIYLNRAQ